MATKVTAGAVLRRAAEIGVLPDSFSLVRRRGAEWAVGELSYTLWVRKDADDSLSWTLHVGDAKLGPRLSDFGMLTVPVRDTRSARTWPTSLDQSMDDFIRDAWEPALRVVADRSDLALLLAANDDVHRGHFSVWLPEANLPARLVQSLIIARDLGDRALEDAVLTRLHDGTSRELPNGRTIDKLYSARQWARDYSAALGYEVAI